jgi:O-antigen/teichoic acid export membrane protein
MLQTHGNPTLKIDGVPHAAPEMADLQRQSELAPQGPLPAGRSGGAVVRGSLWTIAGFGAGQFIRLAGNIAVSRLVMPEAFGVMALVNVFAQGLTMFSDVGIEPAIVQNRRGDEPAFYNTAWTVQAIRGVVLLLATCLVAWPAAQFYDEPRLTWLLPISAAASVLAGLNSTALFAVRRHLQLGRLTLLDLTAQIVGVGVMVGLAWRTAGVEALIAGTIASAAVTLAGSHFLVAGYRNRPNWDRAALVELFHFGKWIFLSTIVTFCALQIDRLLLGKLLTKELLGIYSVAAAIALLPNMILQTLAGAVLYPLLARWARRSPDDLRRRVADARDALLAMGSFFVVGIVLEAPTFFQLLYDDRYAAAGDVARWLACGVWLTMLSTTIERVPQALGDTRSLAVYNFCKLAACATLATIGFSCGGLAGFILGHACGILIGHVVLSAAAAGHQVSVWRQDVSASAATAIFAFFGLTLASSVEQSYGPVVREAAVWTYLTALGFWALTKTQRLKHLGD